MASKAVPGTPLGLPKRRQYTDQCGGGQASRKSKLPLFGRGSTAGRSSIAAKPRASSISRQSDTGRNSRSSVYGQGIPSIKKDPRPLNDKSYQQASIKKLCAFLTQKGYPRDVKLRTLQSPSTKEFLYILNFILELHNPSLIINGIKLEEEIPFVLKFLGYPFSVSKNHILSIGSPHSWPIMLGVLTWLMEPLTEGDSCNALFGKETFDGENLKEFEFEQMANLYHTFLEVGDDSVEFKQAMEQRTESLKSTFEEKKSHKEELEGNTASLQQQIEELQQSSVESLRQQLEEMQHKCDLTYNYIQEDLIPNIESLEHSDAQLNEDIKHMHETIASQKQCIVELQEAIKTQPISAREAQQLKKEIKDKTDSLEKLYQEKYQALERVNELQMLHNQSVQKIDTACCDVNERLRKLTATVPDASFLTPLNYNSSKRADLSVLNQLIEQAKAIKNGLQGLIGRVSTKCSETERTIIDLTANISALENEIVKQKLELEENESKVKREETLLEQAKKNLEGTMRAEIGQKNELETMIVKLQQELDDKSIENEAAQTKAKTEEDIMKLAKGLEERTNALQEVCVVLTHYLEAEKTQERMFKEQYDRVLSVYKEIKPPSVKAKYLKDSDDSDN